MLPVRTLKEVLIELQLWCLLVITLLSSVMITLFSANTLRPRQDGRHFAEDTFNRIFVNENVRISIEFLLKFVPKGQINNIPAWFR